MHIFTWIVLGLTGLLLVVSGVCWALFIALDAADWRRLAVKVFRIAMVFLLFYVNVFIYAHIFGVFKGTEKPVPAIIDSDSP